MSANRYYGANPYYYGYQVPGTAAVPYGPGVNSGAAPAAVMPQSAAPAQNAPAAGNASLMKGWFAFNDPGYIKGLVLGAGLAYVLANPKVQRSVLKGAVNVWSTVQGGFEEVKERILDIRSEMSMQDDSDGDE